MVVGHFCRSVVCVCLCVCVGWECRSFDLMEGVASEERLTLSVGGGACVAAPQEKRGEGQGGGGRKEGGRGGMVVVVVMMACFIECGCVLTILMS